MNSITEKWPGEEVYKDCPEPQAAHRGGHQAAGETEEDENGGGGLQETGKSHRENGEDPGEAAQGQKQKIIRSVQWLSHSSNSDHRSVQ